MDERPLRLLVCDANVPPKEVSDILLHLARALGLAKGGWVVTTFKNFCKGYAEWRAHIAAAVPTAWPVQAHVAMTRADVNATCELEMLRPAIIRFGTLTL